jgi:hypothetical protein
MTTQPSRGLFGKLVFGTLVALTSLVVIPIVRLVFKRQPAKKTTNSKVIDVQAHETMSHVATEDIKQ